MLLLMRPTPITQTSIHRHRINSLTCSRPRGICRRCQPVVQGCSSSKQHKPHESSSSQQSEQAGPSRSWISSGLPLLLAGSVAINTLVAGPLLLGPLPANADTLVSKQSRSRQQPQPAYTLADAPSVHADAEAPAQLQWWQQDQQVKFALLSLEPTP